MAFIRSCLVLAAVIVCAPGMAFAQAPACIGVVLANVQGVEGSATDVGRAVREVFASYLTGPAIRVELLEARLAGQAAEEAKQKNCAHLLTTTLTRKRGGGFGVGKILGRTGTSAAWGISGGGVAGALTRGAIAAGAEAVTEMASSTKAKDEMRLEYRLVSIGEPKPLLQKEEKLKASVDGEDLVTPMVQKAAEAIAGVVTR